VKKHYASFSQAYNKKKWLIKLEMDVLVLDKIFT
jgi:hypothetical protein